ncbi:predicted protein [Botrytis cinerea T4]|uniref:Uncharacterized protein n=1 Tax=Botryotinia fuckeliana (strain T4) TaxID=999810 RepID=G2YMS1_BOTF4|nr:predicted protein [Botrytis cinerea T4]
MVKIETSDTVRLGKKWLESHNRRISTQGSLDCNPFSRADGLSMLETRTC